MPKKDPVEPEKRGRGRPATGRKRDHAFLVRMTAEERDVINRAAAKAGLPTTVWALGVMLSSATQAVK